MTLILLIQQDYEVVRSGDPDEMYRHLNDLRTQLARAEVHATEICVVDVYPQGMTGVYRDGELIAYDESLSLGDVFKAMGLIFKTQVRNADWLDENGMFPKKLPYKEYETMA